MDQAQRFFIREQNSAVLFHNSKSGNFFEAVSRGGLWMI